MRCSLYHYCNFSVNFKLCPKKSFKKKDQPPLPIQFKMAYGSVSNFITLFLLTSLKCGEKYGESVMHKDGCHSIVYKSKKFKNIKCFLKLGQWLIKLSYVNSSL